ncbi:MAG: hypothetical protein ABR954_06340 [Dehalococcoidales bacterium]
MDWFLQHSSNFANAGIAVILIGLALRLLPPNEASKRHNNGIKLLVLGIIILLLGYFGSSLKLSGTDVLITSGAAVFVAGIFELIQWAVDIGKSTWHHVYIGVWVACIVGALLVVLSVIASSLPR